MLRINKFRLVFLCFLFFSCSDDETEDINFCLYEKVYWTCKLKVPHCKDIEWKYIKCVTFDESLQYDRDYYKVESCYKCK